MSKGHYVFHDLNTNLLCIPASSNVQAIHSSIHLSVYLSVLSSIHPNTNPSTHPCARLSITFCAFTNPSAYTSIHPPICLSFHPSSHQPIHPTIHSCLSSHHCFCASINSSVHPSICPSFYSSIPKSIHPTITPTIHPSTHPSVCPSIQSSLHQFNTTSHTLQSTARLAWASCAVPKTAIGLLVASKPVASQPPASKTNNATTPFSQGLPVQLIDLVVQAVVRPKVSMAVRVETLDRKDWEACHCTVTERLQDSTRCREWWVEWVAVNMLETKSTDSILHEWLGYTYTYNPIGHPSTRLSDNLLASHFCCYNYTLLQ